MLQSWGGGMVTPQPIEAEELRGSGFVANADRGKKAIVKPRFSPVVGRNMQDPTGKYLWLFSGSK